MDCTKCREQLGAHLDGELSAADRQTVEAHLDGCTACRAELESLRALAVGLAAPVDTAVPAGLWPAIERRLDADRGAAHRRGGAWHRRAPFRIAATIALAAGGLALYWSVESVDRAQAAVVNFGIILDTLPLDAEKAFRKFLVLYQAEEIDPREAAAVAPELHFEIPATLPGGFARRAVYRLRFGESPGVAARYDRAGEFLVTVFHATMFGEDFGSHADYPCVIGRHCGQKVEVGEWKLVHLTDPTTCHCVLSRLDEATELPAVLSAVAPSTEGLPPAPGHTHADH